MSGEQAREQLVGMLRQRGIEGATSIADEFGDEELAAAFAAVGRWDDARSKSSGLLVYMLRQREPVELPSTQGERRPSETLLRSIRGRCNSPNGVSRDEVRKGYADYIENRNRAAEDPKRQKKPTPIRLSADELIDLAMGSDWQETPTHPALKFDAPPGAYDCWVAGEPQVVELSEGRRRLPR